MGEPNVGTHRARAYEAQLGEAGTGTPQVGCMFEIVDGQDQPTGEYIAWYGFLTDNALKRTIESLRHTGWQGEDISDLATVGTKICSIEVGEEEYEGTTRLRVKWVNADGGGVRMARPFSADEARAFAAKMRGKVIAATGGRSTATSRSAAARPAAPTAPRPPAPRPMDPARMPGPATAAPATPPPPGDDDIPF